MQLRRHKMKDTIKITNSKSGLSKTILNWEYSAEDILKMKAAYKRAGYKVEEQ